MDGGPEQKKQPDEEGRERRLSVIMMLTFGLFMTAAVAIFPLVTDAHRLSGIWISICAAVGLD